MDSPDAPIPYPRHPGHISNRPLTTELPLTEPLNPHERDILSIFGISFEAIKRKRVLNIGFGKGQSLVQALRIGEDHLGLDIAPLIRDDRSVYSRLASEAQDAIRQIAKEYPGRIVASDGSVSLPYPDRSMDVVLACLSLPHYAKTEKGKYTSLFEMIRVAKDMIYVTTKPNEFDAVFNQLKEFGLTWEQHETPYDDSREAYTSAHINVSQLDRTAFREFTRFFHYPDTD